MFIEENPNIQRSTKMKTICIFTTQKTNIHILLYDLLSSLSSFLPPSHIDLTHFSFIYYTLLIINLFSS